MTKLVTTLIMATLLLCACSPGLSTADSEAVVSKFHQQFDAGSFDQIYQASSPELKISTSKEKFLSYMTAVHDKLGPIQSTKQASWRVLAGTKGNYIDLVYNTKFEHGGGVESFRFRTDLGAPQLVGYNINSSDMISNEKPGIQASAGSNAILHA